MEKLAETIRKMHISFFKKLIIIMLAVNIPLLLSIAVFCYHSMRTIRQDTIKNVQIRQQNLIDIVENDVKYVEQQLYHISNMDDWNILRETSRGQITYEGVSALNQFRSRFQNVLGTSRLFMDISANLENADLRFSVNEGIDGFDAQEYEALQSEEAGAARFKSREGSLYITSLNAWNYDLSVSMAARMDWEKIRNLLADGRSFLNEQMMLVFYTESGAVTICDGMTEALYRKITEADTFSPEDSKEVQKHMILIHTSSAMGDFAIYSFVEKNDIYAAMKKFYGSLFGIMAGSAIVILTYGIIVNKMFKKVTQLIDENYAKELYAQRAVYRQLQSQINPHFLYNSFFVLQNMIREEENESASEFTKSLGQYYKFITRTERQEVALKEEVDHARVYLEIMKKRYGRRLEYEIVCGEAECLQIQVPRLILQPFIENVFGHGSHSGRDPMKIRLQVLREKEQIWIIIEDNGSGMEEQRLKDLAGELFKGDETKDSAIFNINRRIKIKFGSDYGVILENSSLGGCRVCLRLPGIEQKGAGQNYVSDDCSR